MLYIGMKGNVKYTYKSILRLVTPTSLVILTAALAIFCIAIANMTFETFKGQC